MFTIKSVSSDGTYYLVKNWREKKTFWKLASEIRAKDMYKREQDAVSALTKLLKVMDEYKSDTFTLIETDNTGRIVNETPVRVTERRKVW